MSTKPEINIGIIGCGGIANGKHMPALKTIEGVRMTAFYDFSPERATAAAEAYGVPGAKVYQDYQDLLCQPSIHAVHVLTPNSSHAEIACAAMRAGKDVMCEKPMAISSAQAKEMLDVSRETGRKLTIGYQNRFRPECLYLKKCCEQGDLGEIYYARAQAIRRRAVPTWGVFLDAEKQGGGPLIDIGTHALDLTLWCMDNYQPDMVVGAVYRKLGDRENAANKWGAWDPKKYTVEDSAFGFVRMKNGATIYLESSWALNTLLVDEAKTILCGTEGGADLFGPPTAPLRLNGEKYGRTFETLPEFEGGNVAYYGRSVADPGVSEAEAWIACLRGEGELMVKPEQAYVVTQILEAVYESGRSGKPVFF